MKKAAHTKEADQIGHDSYELQHYEQLSINANRESQIAALKRDQEWQRDHHDEVSGSIDRLISDIENG